MVQSLIMVINRVGGAKVEIHFGKNNVLALIFANKQLRFSSVANASNTLNNFVIFFALQASARPYFACRARVTLVLAIAMCGTVVDHGRRETCFVLFRRWTTRIIN